MLAACMSGVVEEVTQMGVSLGGVFGAVAMAVPAYVLLPWYWSVLYAVVGFELGTMLMSVPFIVVDVTSSTIFMCFPLNHEACERTKPEMHARLCAAYAGLNRPGTRFCSCCGCCADSEADLENQEREAHDSHVTQAQMSGVLPSTEYGILHEQNAYLETQERKAHDGNVTQARMSGVLPSTEYGILHEQNVAIPEMRDAHREQLEGLARQQRNVSRDRNESRELAVA
jgi:hypothetical protein